VSSGPDTTELVRAFNFRVNLVKSAGAVEGAKEQTVASRLTSSTNVGRDTIGNGGFQECTGLEIELDVQELQEGGRNDGVIRRIGRAKYQPITLKRGMFSANPGGRAFTELWGWLQQVASGERVVRYDGTVEVLDTTAAQNVVATWTFVRGLPLKVSGPQLNARTGEVAIEELQIAHEGLVLELLQT
jgi:phage tail-like protein